MKHPAFGRNLTSLPGVLPLHTRRVTYLDTNALSDLSRWRDRAPHIEGIEQVSRELCSFASKRTIALGQWLFSEISYLEQGLGRDDFLADMQFINQLQHLEIFRASGEMMKLEVEAFIGRVEVNPAISNALPRPFDDAEWKRVWNEERTQLAKGKTEFGQWEAEAEQRTASHYPDRNDTAARLAKDWTADRHGIVSRMVVRAMRWLKVSLRLPRYESLWPRPEQVPTLWCNWAFRITRDILLHTLPNPRKRRASDFVDWCHYMTAAHADEVVTTDKWFSRIAAECPGPKPEFLTLEEWVERLGSER